MTAWETDAHSFNVAPHLISFRGAARNKSALPTLFKTDLYTMTLELSLR
jgi:hypothetical protein